MVLLLIPISLARMTPLLLILPVGYGRSRYFDNPFAWFWFITTARILAILAFNKKHILNLKSIILAHFIILLYWSILLILDFAVSVDLPLR